LHFSDVKEKAGGASRKKKGGKKKRRSLSRQEPRERLGEFGEQWQDDSGTSKTNGAEEKTVKNEIPNVFERRTEA